MNWYLYIVKCADSSLYTGITTDLVRRIKEHNTDTTRGAKSLRGKKPVVLVYSETLLNRSAASLREAAIKKMSRTEKLDLIKNVISS
ncbi:MAG: GIY-YIG nuclease family protein [Microgenomates group bacterium]